MDTVPPGHRGPGKRSERKRGPLDVAGWAWLSGTYLALHQMKKTLTAVFLLALGAYLCVVGDTGFEPVTLSSWRHWS